MFFHYTFGPKIRVQNQQRFSVKYSPGSIRNQWRCDISEFLEYTYVDTSDFIQKKKSIYVKLRHAYRSHRGITERKLRKITISISPFPYSRIQKDLSWKQPKQI